MLVSGSSERNLHVGLGVRFELRWQDQGLTGGPPIEVHLPRVSDSHQAPLALLNVLRVVNDSEPANNQTPCSTVGFVGDMRIRVGARVRNAPSLPRARAYGCEACPPFAGPAGNALSNFRFRITNFGPWGTSC